MLSDLGKSVMSMFSPSGGAKITPAPGNTPMSGAQQQNMGTQGEAPKAPGSDGTNKTDQNLSGSEDASKSPLDDFTKLWENPTVDPKAVKPVSAESLLDFDPAKLSAVSRKLDFTKGLDPAIMKKAQEGDAGSFAAVMNYVTQNSFAQAMHAMSGVAKNALTKQRETMLADMPGEISKHTTRNEMASNPLYSHPATQPLIEPLVAQLRLKNPDATPQQIKAHVDKYLDGVVELARGKEKPNTSKSPFGNDDVDWGEFFDEAAIKS
jgi:hypothetical protein